MFFFKKNPEPEPISLNIKPEGFATIHMAIIVVLDLMEESGGCIVSTEDVESELMELYKRWEHRVRGDNIATVEWTKCFSKTKNDLHRHFPPIESNSKYLWIPKGYRRDPGSLRKIHQDKIDEKMGGLIDEERLRLKPPEVQKEPTNWTKWGAIFGGIAIFIAVAGVGLAYHKEISSWESPETYVQTPGSGPSPSE